MQSQSLLPRSNGAALSNNTAFRGPGVRSVHFAPSVEMPLRTGQSSVLGPSRARNAPYAPPGSAPSARSWVYPYNQHQPTPLPSSPTDQPSQLPGPFHKRKGLHVIDAIMGDDDELDDTENTTQTNSLGIDFGHHQAELPPSKNKGKNSIIGRVFRGVGTVFGKESNSGDRKLRRKTTVSNDTVPTSATYGDSSSNTNSAPDAPGPSSTLGLGFGHRVPHNVPTPILEVSETEYQGATPPPDVLRLSDNIPPLQSRARPPPTTTSNHRPKSVSRKPVNAGASSSRFVETAMTAESAASHTNNNHIMHNDPNLEDRTTVMIYDQNHSRAPTGVQTPLVISRHPSSRASVQQELVGTGTGPPSFQPLRPTSFAATQQTHAAPGSIRDPASVAPTRRTSIASPLAPRSRQLSLNRGIAGQAPSASSIPDFPPGPYPPHPTSRAVSAVYQAPPLPLPPQAPTTTNPELNSPISTHPLPTEDYLKMTLSPPSSKHTITTSNTTYSSNPSFSSDLSPFARFVKTLYKMPWVSHDRVTVDYLPDHGLLGAKNVKPKKGKVKRTTWYRSMLASRRNSDNPTVDLLGRGRGRGERRRQRDLDVSLGAALSELGSPFAATRRRKGRTERSRKHHHHHHRHHNRHHPSSSRHQHHHHGRRATTTTMSDDSTNDSVLQSGSPLAPAMYPYFPPFPMAFQQPFAQNDQSPPTTAGLAAAHQPTAAYQTLFSPTPFYVYPTPGQTVEKHAAPGGDPNPNMRPPRESAVPPVLVPGGVDREHVPGAFS